MMKKKLFVMLVSSVIATGAMAQNTPNAVSLNIPSVKAGTCQALVVVPAKFQPRTEQVVVKEASQTIEIVPAEYEWVEKQVEIKPATEKLEVIPATYKTVDEQIEIEPATVQKKVVEPQYAEVTDSFVSKPAYLSAVSDSPAGKQFASVGEVMRLVEVPETNTTITKRVVQEGVQVKETPVEAKYVTVKKQVVDQPAQVKKIPVEAEYKTVKVKKLVKEAQEVKHEIPAEYSEVTVYDKVADAQMRWETVLCSGDEAKPKIEDVQRALNAVGYNAGVVDGAMGPSTTKALERYQKDHNLAVGGITLETLKSLGVK